MLLLNLPIDKFGEAFSSTVLLSVEGTAVEVESERGLLLQIISPFQNERQENPVSNHVH